MVHSPTKDSAHFRIQSALDLRMAIIDVRRMPSLAQFSAVDVSMLATVVAELGSNILKYAGQGHIRIQPTHDGSRHGVTLVAEDNGPGIPDVDRALQEHYSSSGTLGLGLSGVRRMVSDFQLNSSPGHGCQVQVRKWMALAQPVHLSSIPPTRPGPSAAAQPPPNPNPTHASLVLEVAEANRPCYPEYVSGDSTVVCQLPHGLLLACIDASGHGQKAHALSTQLAALVRNSSNKDLPMLLHTLHQRAMGTIGAAVALAFVDTQHNELLFAGIGNIRIRCVGASTWAGISRDGVLGERFPSTDLQRFPLRADDVVLLHSDGIHTHLSPQVLSRLHLGSARQIADTLLTHSGKTTDDASCIVLKCKT